AICDGLGNVGDVADLRRQVTRHRIDTVSQIFPGARYASHVSLPAESPLGADLARDAGNFRRKRAQLIDHRVDGAFELEAFAFDVAGDLLCGTAVCDGRGNVGDVADLRRQVAGHRVDTVSQVLPGAGDALDLRLAAQLAFGADLARDAGNF